MINTDQILKLSVENELPILEIWDCEKSNTYFTWGGNVYVYNKKLEFFSIQFLNF